LIKKAVKSIHASGVDGLIGVEKVVVALLLPLCAFID
jgi:hypothetical protein